MSKATYCNELLKSHVMEAVVRRNRTSEIYKNKDENRWLEVRDANYRKMIRKARRSTGKANKRHARRTAMDMARSLSGLPTGRTNYDIAGLEA